MSKVTMPKKIVIWSNDHEAVIWIMAILLIAGSVNIFSSTFVMAEDQGSPPYFYLLKHLITMGAGGFLFLICYWVDYHRWRSVLVPITVVIVFMLVYVLVFGTAVNGSKRWIYIGSFSVQPAEFAKICSVMIESYYLSFCIQKQAEIAILAPQHLALVLLAGLVEMEPDMGTMMIILGVPFLMLFISGLTWAKVKRLLIVIAAAVAALCAYQPYRLQRIQVMLDPWADAQGTGYQTVQSLTAIGSGGFWGMGLGEGLAKYAYLPEAHTDFAFAVFCQENGFLFAVGLIIIYATLGYFGVRIASKAHDAYGQILAGGLVILICVQATANMMMVAGFLPVVGVPLPFISYGGCSLLVSMAALGILVNINRYSLAQKRKMERLIERNLAMQQRQPLQKATGKQPRLTRIK